MPELIVSLKGREVSRHPITTTQTTIGRAAGCEVTIDNVGVSRQHAVIMASAGVFVVMDAGSANGLFVNGIQTEEHELNHGDEIQVGKFTLTYSSRGGVEDHQLVDNTGQNPESRGGISREATFALSADEVQRVLAASRQSAAAARSSPSTSQGQRRADTHRRVQLERKVKSLNALTVILILLVLGLGGLAAYLMLR